MGAAWRDLHGRKSGFKRILEMVKEVRGMGMEVCTTLGMLDAEQARQLKEAGLTAYNHNLDTSREFYPKVRFVSFCMPDTKANTGHHHAVLCRAPGDHRERPPRRH
jgi:hypothetical protein